MEFSIYVYYASFDKLTESSFHDLRSTASTYLPTVHALSAMAIVRKLLVPPAIARYGISRLIIKLRC